MKKASELGLELIKLEDQILLVDENKPRVYGDYYVLKNSWGLNKHEVTKWTEAKHAILSGKKSKPTGVIVASTKPLEGLPLLVIENEVDEKLFRTVKNEQGQLIDYEFTLEVKITENKIKAVWK